MKPETKLTPEQKAAIAIGAKIANPTPEGLSDFMDRVQARLDLYDERDAALVTERPKKHS